jgi:hypothetical protein
VTPLPIRQPFSIQPDWKLTVEDDEFYINERAFRALERLAASTWGKQGIGGCRNKAVWIELVHRGLAHPIQNEEEHILAVTLKGFRTLHAMLRKKAGESND